MRDTITCGPWIATTGCTRVAGVGFRRLGIAALVVAASMSPRAASPAPGDRAARTIERLIALVEENYVLEERVEPIVARLRRGLESGDYAALWKKPWEKRTPPRSSGSRRT